jgi:hypothetical protein
VLALSVLAAAVVLVRYLVVHDNPARAAEERAVQAIERLGGKVLRDEKAPGKPVIAVFLNTPAMTDAGLEVLGELKQLRELDLTGSRVTASGLKELAGLQQLQTLHIDETQWIIRMHGRMRVDPGPWEPLVRLRQLKTLYVNDSRWPRMNAGQVELIQDTFQRWLHERLPGCRVIFR